MRRPRRPRSRTSSGVEAVVTGALGDNATGGYLPAHAEVSDGVVTLWVASPQGWVQYVSVPATEVVETSAAQRITLEVRGRKYQILAFIAAASQSGARVSRLGYGAIAAIGCGGAVVAVVLALLLAVLLTR